MNTATRAIGCLLLTFFLSSQSFADTTYKNQKKRFIKACVTTKSPKLCDCFYGAHASVANKKQLELAIAYLAKDKAMQNEIKSDPAFDNKAYNANAMPVVMKTAACLKANR